MSLLFFLFKQIVRIANMDKGNIEDWLIWRQRLWFFEDATRESVALKELTLASVEIETKIWSSKRIVRSTSFGCDLSQLDAERCLEHCQWEDNGGIDERVVQHAQKAICVRYDYIWFAVLSIWRWTNVLVTDHINKFNVITTQLN